MAKATSIQDWHALDFFCDDAGSCALTVLVRGFRFHIIADSDEISGSTTSGKRYNELVKGLRNGDKAAPSTSSSGKDPETDSGVDLSEDDGSKRNGKLDPEEALQRFMLEPLSDQFNELSDANEEKTLQEWYNAPTYFYDLKVSKNNDIEATQLEASSDLTQRMEKLKPEMPLPKYLTDKLGIPIYQASDLAVVDTSDQPPGTPYHPCRVRHKDTERTSFVKIVDPSQPQPLKRELDILYRSMQLKLNKEINVPSLEGLVVFNDAEPTKNNQKRIMGFLQTHIPDAKPLTSLIDSSISQSKREHWAEEAEHAKEVLHKHNIVWGDAKADNFVVDKDDKLWIIDFGGSYTEGWVDPELNETVEGDDMGTEKIVNALEDPVGNTYDPDDKEGHEEVDGGDESAGVREKASATSSPDQELKKRKREERDEEIEDENVDAGKSSKAQKKG